MNLESINPYIRSAAHFRWTYRNLQRSISYHMRFFAFRNNPAILQVKDWQLTVEPESLLILPPGVPYDFQYLKPEQWFDLYCCTFDLTQEYRYTKPYIYPVHERDFHPEQIVDTTSVFPSAAEPVVIQNCSEFCKQVQNVYEIFAAQDTYAEEICSGIIKTVLFQALQRTHMSESDEASCGAETARRIMQYIREHFMENINEQSIAKAMRYHPYYLTRLLRKHYDTTPYRYLLQCRCDYGIQMLLHTDLPVGEIAAACGFLSQAHFARVIGRQTGMSPSKFRKIGRKEGQGVV